MNPVRLDRLPHNIGIERTGRDPVKETTHTVNVPGRANSKTSERLAAAAEISLARTHPLTWQAQSRRAMRKPRQDIRETARITGVTGTRNQMAVYRPLPGRR